MSSYLVTSNIDHGLGSGKKILLSEGEVLSEIPDGLGPLVASGVIKKITKKEAAFEEAKAALHAERVSSGEVEEFGGISVNEQEGNTEDNTIRGNEPSPEISAQ